MCRGAIVVCLLSWYHVFNRLEKTDDCRNQIVLTNLLVIVPVTSLTRRAAERTTKKWFADSSRFSCPLF